MRSERDWRKHCGPGLLMPPSLPTDEAARYCGFKTKWGLLSAFHRGLVFPIGRRGGGRGTYMWQTSTLDAYLAGEKGSPNGRVDSTQENRGGRQGERPWNLPDESRRIHGADQGHRPRRQEAGSTPGLARCEVAGGSARKAGPHRSGQGEDEVSSVLRELRALGHSSKGGGR